MILTGSKGAVVLRNSATLSKVVYASKIFHAATNLVDVKKWDGAVLLLVVVK